MIIRRILFVGAVLMLGWSMILAQPKEVQAKWNMTVRLLVADNCPATGCACLVGGGPHHGYCRAVALLQIIDGNYGTVSLKGQNVGIAMEFTDKETNYMGYYIDELAAPDVKKVLRWILSSPPFGTVGEGFTIKETSIKLKYVPGKTSSFSLGKYGDITMMPLIGREKNKQIKIVNPTYPFPASEVYLSASKGKFSDYGKDLILDNNSGEISEFSLSGGG